MTSDVPERPLVWPRSRLCLEAVSPALPRLCLVKGDLKRTGCHGGLLIYFKTRWAAPIRRRPVGRMQEEHSAFSRRHLEISISSVTIDVYC